MAKINSTQYLELRKMIECQQGQLDYCLTELAQVGAVVMRCMVYVLNERRWK